MHMPATVYLEGPMTDSNEFYQRGLESFKQHNYDDALVFFSRAIELKDCFIEAHYHRGLTYIALHRYNYALMDFKRAITCDSSFAAAYYQCGWIYFIQNDNQRALENFTRAIERHPSFASAYFKRGIIYHNRLRRYEEALADFERAERYGYWGGKVFSDKIRQRQSLARHYEQDRSAIALRKLSKEQASASALLPPAVLIALDDSWEQRSVVLLLEGQGFTVIEANDGLDVLSQFARQLFDLILIDLYLPFMDGFELIGELRRRDEDISILVFTAHATPENEELVRRAGASDFLARPCQDEQIIIRVKALLAGRS